MDEAVVGTARRVREDGLRTFGVVVVMIGATVGWFLADGVRWLLSLPWVPLRGPLRVVDRLVADLPATTTAALGAFLGVALAAMAWRDRHELVVDDAEVVLRRGPARTVVPRRDVENAFVDGKALVLTTGSGAEVLRSPTRLPRARLERVLVAAGVRWHAADPLLTEFRPWAPGSAAGAVDALLVARRQALEGGRPDDADVLRDQLWTLGVMVRDEGSRQSWRAVRSTTR